MNAASLEVFSILLLPEGDAVSRRLRDAASRVDEWRTVVDVAEKHGVLLRLMSRLGGALVSLPQDAIEHAEKRHAAVLADEARFRFTVTETSAALRTRGIDAVWLKGAAALVYGDHRPLQRSQGDIDVLVRTNDVGAAIAALAPLGHALSPQALGLFWYRVAHFHVGLPPAVAFFKPVEIHWHLHAPALLHTVDLERLWRRTQEVATSLGPFRVLDPVDHYLHLATHLESHWFGVPERPFAEVLEAMLGVESPVRLKWLADLVDLAALSDAPSTEDLLATAAEWHAEASLGAVSRLCSQIPGLDGSLRARFEELAHRGREHRDHAVTQAAPASSMSIEKSSVFEFREASLRRLPNWLFPPNSYFEARSRSAGRGPTQFGFVGARLFHLVDVCVRILIAVLFLPLAWLAGRLDRARRRAVATAALEPEAALRWTMKWRRFSGGSRGDG